MVVAGNSEPTKGKAVTSLQVLQGHGLDQRGFASPSLPYNVEMRKAIFLFDTENTIVTSKIDPPNVYDIITAHWHLSVYLNRRGRVEIRHSGRRL
jgi:hypothetical protein